MFKFDYESKIWGNTKITLSPFCLTAPKLKFALNSLKLVKKGSKILEVGCGAGGLAIAIKKYRPDLKVYGIDISKFQIALAKKSNHGVNFSMGSAYRIPFKKDSFDAVVMFDVLEHLDKPGLAVGEINRVVKPNGIYSLFTPIEGNIFSVHGLSNKIFNFIPKEKYGGHVQNFNYQDVIKILNHNKFAVKYHNYYGHLFNQVVDFSYFCLLSLKGKNVESSVESYLDNNKGFTVAIIRLIKNLIAFISYIESRILFFFPGSGVNILSRNERTH